MKEKGGVPEVDGRGGMKSLRARQLAEGESVVGKAKIQAKALIGLFPSISLCLFTADMSSVTDLLHSIVWISTALRVFLVAHIYISPLDQVSAL